MEKKIRSHYACLGDIAQDIAKMGVSVFLSFSEGSLGWMLQNLS